ncbi:MAG TPA: quinone oxidoreductase [Chthoniobacterales bacterium]|jgi:NADPH2:quinone reductase|nr:quinone oxidoreductase [Chthoniobacterales bacterium]
MKAIRFHTHGGPEVLKLEETPVPEPGTGEVLVRVVAAGVNFIDVYQRSGLYKVALPYTIGVEGAGIVEKTGSEVDIAPGSRVAWFSQPGAFAEFAVVAAARLVPVPEGLDLSSAAAALLQGITAQYLCETTYPAKEGDRALVHAGAGGVGLLLVQMLKHKGATVFTTVSTPEKAKLATAAGADAAILYTQEDFVRRVKELTKGQGVNVVYDSVGVATYQGGFEVLKPLGMLVLFGQSSGRVPPIDPSVLVEKGSLFLTRPSVVHYAADRQALIERSGKVFDWIRQGWLHLRIVHRFPLADAAQAYRDLENRKTTGKILITVAPE